MSLTPFKSITIQGEPYNYAQASKRYLMFTGVDRNTCVVVQPGEYVLVDRHFKTYICDEKQMNYYIRDDFARWQRTQNKGQNGERP